MNVLNFFASAKGRRFTFYASVGAAIGTFSLSYFPHTFLANNYHREFVASYKEGVERSVSPTLQKRFEVAVDILKLSDFERKYIEPFMVSGFECYRIGSTQFKFGALVGIPVNYSYTRKDEIDKMSMMVRGNPVDWNSQGGLLLEQSLVLAPDEQVFGMAREIIQLQSNEVYLNSIYSTGSIVGYYILTSGLNSRMRFFYKPLSLRVALYTLSSLFVFGIYSFLTDFTQVRFPALKLVKNHDLNVYSISGEIRHADRWKTSKSWSRNDWSWCSILW